MEAAATAPPPPNEPQNQAYFERQQAETQIWAARMGIDLPKLLAPGTEMLDFGCGHGALSVHAATCGARVTGIDTSRNRIDFATRNLRNFPALQPAIDFICADIASLPGQSRFDTILSKDTFEHVTSPAGILAAFHRLLRPGGRAYIGFSPLWYSPFGDHGFLTRRKFPWLHLLRGEAPFLAAHNAHTGLNDRTIPEAGFNRQTPADFRTAIAQSGLKLERARINQAAPLKRVAFLPLTLARHVAPIERYATIGMYLTLRK